MFGPHLIMEAYGCEPSTLTSIDKLTELLDNLPSNLGMTKIMPPYVFKYKGKVEEEWGLSGVVLIAESHIAFHTFPDQNNFLTVDIFSCKEFDVAEAVAKLVEIFKPTKYDHRLIMRGREYPRHIGKAGVILETERLSSG
jgi:S-adenosylmethionine decarboxylase